MDTSRRLAGLTLLTAGSALSSLLLVAGVHLWATPLKWVIYLPFYITLLFSALIWRVTMYKVEVALLFLAGTVFTTLYLAFLVEKIPRTISYKVLGVFFFIFLLIMGRSVFLGIMYLPQFSFRAAVHSVQVFGEFLIILLLLYLLLERDALTAE